MQNKSQTTAKSEVKSKKIIIQLSNKDSKLLIESLKDETPNSRLNKAYKKYSNK